ncbi:MAG: SRPBCC family protein [Acidimicrobiia bacterium]|jgi:uncharacterized membrane protein
MRQVERSIVVESPADQVWRLLIDFEEWPRWGPSISSVSATADRAGPGVTGQVRTIVGVSLPFEITGWDPGRSWSWRVAGIPATGHGVESLGPATTRVTFTVPWLAAPYATVLAAGLRRLKRLAEDH